MANNTDATCIRCGKGHYKAFDLNDDIFGDLRCDNCRHHVKTNQDLGKRLSPQAQAVLDAYGNQIGGTDAIMGSERRGVAAALRAAALYCKRDSIILLSLADELEGSNS